MEKVDKMGLGSTMLCHMLIQDKTRQDKTRQDKTRQDKTRQDKTRQTNYGLLKFGFVNRIFYRSFLLLLLIFLLLVQSVLPFSLVKPKSAFAYTTGMSASVVLGQPDFTSSTANNGGISASSLSGTGQQPTLADGKLVVSDAGNNRVLIWNSIPTTNNKAADLVLCQPDFTSSTANNGGISASTCNSPTSSAYSNGRLFVEDRSNNRILIWNSFPTRNGQAADLVLGQPNFTSSTANNGGIGANTLNTPNAVTADGNKLAVVESGNKRILIWNSLPTTNQQPADVVLQQANFTSSGDRALATFGSRSQACQYSCGLNSGSGHLFLSDRLYNRVLIWNSFPTANDTAADVVIGQPDFTSSTVNNGGVSAKSINFSRGTFYDGKRLFVGDGEPRILVFNSIPTSNFASADLVIGQSNFTSNTSAVDANHVAAPWLTGNDKYLIAYADGQSRVLIYENIINNPGLTLNNSPEGRDNGLIRLKGTVTIPSTSLYTISNVQYSVNGGGFSGATATDGSFNTTSEEFYFDFDPKSNQQKDSSGNLIDGYTVRVKSTNSNLDVTDNLFYFSPFNQNEPLDNAVTNSTTPTFDFGVIKQKSILKDNLSKYQIQARLGGSDSTAPWETYIDDISIDGTLNNTGTVVVDNDKLKAVYTDDSSRIKVYSKVKTLAGSMQWKVVAVDKTGHTQDSSTRSLRVNTTNTVTTSNFPLAILNISGLGNPNISTTNLSAIKDTYYLGSLTPVFYGIAYTNAKVTLSLTDQNCKSECTKTYSTIANQDSRYGINVLKGDLRWGKKYTTNMSVAYIQDYNELPTFTLSTSGASSKSTTPSTTSQQTTQEKAIPPSVTSPTPQPTPTPTPTPQPVGGQQETPKKNCFLFWCF